MASDKFSLNQNKKYLEAHNVTKYFEEMMSALLKDKPDDPLFFMMKFIQKKAQQIGILLPIQSKNEIANIDGNQKVNSASRISTNSRSYDKPWLSGSGKKNEEQSSFPQDITQDVLNPNNIRNDTTNDVSTNLDDEFRLVNAPIEDTRDKDKLIEENYELLQASKSTVGTKEMLLQMVKDEEEKKAVEKLKLQEKINEKDAMCNDYDCAVELAEDPDLYKAEFNVNSPVVNKPETTVVIQKQIVSSAEDVDSHFKLTMCPNCTKFYQFRGSNGSVNNYSSPNNGNSVILDDLESASQVNGPRPITDINARQNRPTNSKKYISVNDIDSSGKGWPVIDSGSELSANKKLNSRPSPSSRLFQS